MPGKLNSLRTITTKKVLNSVSVIGKILNWFPSTFTDRRTKLLYKVLRLLTMDMLS